MQKQLDIPANTSVLDVVKTMATNMSLYSTSQGVSDTEEQECFNNIISVSGEVKFISMRKLGPYMIVSFDNLK